MTSNMKPTRYVNSLISALTGVLLSLITCGNSIAKTDNDTIPATIPTGIKAFEQSVLCQKHECWLETIKPLRYQGVIEYYFYNYMIVDDRRCVDEAETQAICPQVGIRMLVDNDLNPYMNYPTLIIRWFPVRHKKDINLSIIEDICQSVVKKSCQDLIANGEKFIKNMELTQHKYTDEWNIGGGLIANYGLSPSINPGTNTHRYPQFTFMLNQHIDLQNEALTK